MKASIIILMCLWALVACDTTQDQPAYELSAEEAAQLINPRATENMVYLSARVQGEWKAVSRQTLGDTTSALALHHSLSLVAIAQEVSRAHGEEVLLKLKEHSDSSWYCEMAYDYAKLSNCAIPVKITILREVLECSDSSNDSLLSALASFELLKHHPRFTSEEVNSLVSTLEESLITYKNNNVSVNRYWRLMGEMNDLAEVDLEFKDIVATRLPDELLADMENWLLHFHNDPNFYGVRLYSTSMYDAVSPNVRAFWCNIWR